MKLVGQKVCLRPLVADDLTKMVTWNCDTELQSYVDCDLPGTFDELKRWFESNVPERRYQIFAIETINGGLIGDLELDHICWQKKEAELRIRIGEKDFWGQGFGSEALRLIVDYLLTEKKFDRIYLKVYQFNKRAIHCYLKVGFKQVGILRWNNRYSKEIILMEIARPKYRKALEAT